MNIWSADGQSLYFQGVMGDGSSDLYGVPVGGGEPRVVVQFDDPSKIVQFQLSLSGETIYLTLSEQESDIYVMDLTIP